MRWTDAQGAAIETRGNLIVSAAAGAGKTAVLTERLCRIVEAGTPVDRLLVLTFTRAAAAEMKQRIAQRLNAAMAEERDAARRAYLRRQADAVNTGYICTIDAFCTRVLRRHGHTIGLPGRTRVADEMELALLQDQTRDTLLRDLAGRDDPDWKTLLTAFIGETAAWDAVSGTAAFLTAQADPDAWMAEAARRYADPAYTKTLLDTLLSGHRMTVSSEIDRLTRCHDALSPMYDKLIAMLDDDLMRLRALMVFSDYDGFRTAVMDFSLMRQPVVKDMPEEDKAAVQKARAAVKKSVAGIAATISRTAEEEIALTAAAAPVAESLMRVVNAYREAYAAAKRKRGVVDFADVEHFALQLLGDPKIAAEYRERFLEIAVDEYQDSNGVQEALLCCIRRENNLFVVGDVKQSIYRFRAAEPGLFLQKLEDFSTGGQGCRVDLNENFRSTREVLTAVNAVFSGVMRKEVGELDYDARAALVPGTDAPGGCAELHLIERVPAQGADEPALDERPDFDEPGADDPDGDETGEAIRDAADAEVEARFIAETIQKLMAEGTVFDPALGRERPYRYADFAVLVRATGRAEIFAQTLAVCGVPAYAQSSGGYFDSVEVMVALAVLRAADNPRQDIPLLAAMRSEMGGFTAEELAKLRIAHREGDFFAAVFAAAEPDSPLRAEEPALCDKTAAFLSFLDHWREEGRLLGVPALVTALLDDTGYYDLVGALPGGAQRVRNLDALRDKARQYAASSQGGLSGFLSCMDHAAANVRIGAAQEAAEDVVRILSIHRSKGLEFPVVFVAEAGKRFNFSDDKKPLRLHAALGLGLRFVSDAGVRYDTAAFRAMRETQRLEQLSEEMRVLYVALTRARQKLYIVASVRNAAETLAAAERELPAAAVARCISALPWLMTAAGSAIQAHTHAREAFLTPLRAPKAGHTAEPAFAAAETLAMRFAFIYPYGDAVALPAKQAVSALEARRAYEFAPPAFLEGGAPTAAARGTATHALLETMPLRPLTGAEAAALLAPLKQRFPAASAVRAEDIARWTQTALFARLAASPTVRRELAFGYEAPRELLDDVAAGRTLRTSELSGETVLLQGVIDCCFIEDGAWVLIDYKTDRLAPGESAEEHAQRYRVQLELYARALSALTRIPVRERHIVLLRTGETVAV